MKTKVTVKSVKVYTDVEIPNVEIFFEETIEGYSKQEDGTFAKGDVNSFSIARSTLTRQLCDVSDDIADYRASIDHSFTQKDLGIILRRATLVIEREHHTAGELIGTKRLDGSDRVYDRDCFTTDVVGVTLNERAIIRIDEACSLG